MSLARLDIPSCEPHRILRRISEMASDLTEA